MLSSFVDITPIEKERKYAAASSTAKSDFLAKMSHEIRTPMNGIIGMGEALLKEKLNETQKEFVNIINQSADLLLNIIDDVLDYSKIEAGKMQIEDVPFLLREEVNISMDIFKSISEDKGLSINILIDDKIPDRLIGDPFRLRQVLSNLISNSIKFTHEGLIEIKVKLEEEYGGNITLEFTVSDTGVGIPKDKIETIFNSFTQAELSTSRKYGGSGLGTTICKQLVNLMNGEIWAESPSGLSINTKYPGSSFHFTIEVFSNEIIDKNLDYSNIKTLSEVNALIISLHWKAKKRLYSFFKHQGINVSALDFGEEIIEDIKVKLKNKSPKFHLIVIIDEIGMDGFWVAKELQENGYVDDYRIIILSSNHKPDNFIKARLSKIDYYLISPFDQSKFNVYLKECFPKAKISDSQRLEILSEISILVAEDNIINQKVAESIFHNLGFDIDIAPDGVETVRMVCDKAYDIVFMDLQMPEKDGVEATIDLRNMGYNMPIVAMTASPTEESKTKSLEAGMNDYITKPVKRQTVQAVLEKWFS